jgi:hypothetical protein
MKTAFIRISTLVRSAGLALVLGPAITAAAIPPHQNTIPIPDPPLSVNGVNLVADDSEESLRQIVIQSIDGEQIEVTVAAAKAGPWLGIGSAEASDALDAQLGLRHGEGLVVLLVVTNSPAAKAGVQKNDVLVEFEGQRLVHPVQFRKLLQMKNDGEKVQITLFRAGKKQVVSATLEMPPEDPILHGDNSSGKKIEMQGHRGVRDATSILVSGKTALSPKHGAEAAKSAPASQHLTYMQRQGWKADFRTLVAMAKWLIAPEPSMKCCPASVEPPITTSITEVVHGRSLGNI